MSLERLTIENIRNISNAAVEVDSKINAFYGANGSGKTSLLEAVYFLGSGRTFRSNSTDPLIRRAQDGCTVFGLVRNDDDSVTRLGVSRGRDGSRAIHVDGRAGVRASEAARHLPTLVLGPDTVQLLAGTPRVRRRFLNWGVFHVEPGFSDLWEHANRCLRQRNRLLRNDDGREEELGAWTRELVARSEALDQLRSRYFERYSAAFEFACSQLTGLEQIECRYDRGWDTSRDLEEILAHQLESDRQRGFTQRGFHRADIRVRMAGENVAGVCSRGELKILSWAMVLAQGWLLTQDHGRRPVYLVDDLASELDRNHRQAVCDWLRDTGCQVLVTGVDRDALAEGWRQVPVKMFHVEQGRISTEETFDAP